MCVLFSRLPIAQPFEEMNVQRTGITQVSYFGTTLKSLAIDSPAFAHTRFPPYLTKVCSWLLSNYSSSKIQLQLSGRMELATGFNNLSHLREVDIDWAISPAAALASITNWPSISKFLQKVFVTAFALLLNST